MTIQNQLDSYRDNNVFNAFILILLIIGWDYFSMKSILLITKASVIL